MALTSSLLKLSSGRKYGVVIRRFLRAEAISVWKRMRERVDPPCDGLLSTTMACAPSLLSSETKYFGPINISSEDSSQFSTNVLCNERTASPVTLNMVSRQGASFFTPCHHWSEMPAPPRNPTLPSITISSRWVRLLARGQLYQRSG